MGVGVEQHATEGLCGLYLVLPNLRPLKPSLSALLLQSKNQSRVRLKLLKWFVHTTGISSAFFFVVVGFFFDGIVTWNLVLVLNVTQPLSLPLWCRWCRDMKCSSYNVECEVLLLYMCLLCKHRNNKHTVAYSLYMISLWAALATVVELYIHFRMYNILLSTGTFSARCLLFCCFLGG